MSVDRPPQPAFMSRWQPVRGSDRTLVEQLEDEIDARIADRLLRSGSRLPSVRRMADTAGVSRFTVIEAYERLVARGLIEPRHGSGYFVRSPVEAPVAAEAALVSGLPPSRLDVTWLLRNTFSDGAPVKIRAGAGLLPAGWLDQELVNAAVRSVGRTTGDMLLGYGNPRGHPALRGQLASSLQAEGIPAHQDQHVMTTAGVTHALDLVIRLLVKPGDTVLVEDPGWYLIFGRLAAHGTHIVGVPRGPDGPDLDALDRLAAEHRPRLFLINSVVHNPTGSTLSASTAYGVLRLAEKHDFLVVEDDTYADLCPGAPVRIAALDGLRRVLLVSGYAKTLAAGLRVGMLAAHPDLVARLTDLKLLVGLTTAGLGERVVHHLLREGHYKRHLTRVRRRVDGARQRCIDALTACGLTLDRVPYAGMFVWADCGQDSESVARRASEHGVLLAPGSLFSPSQTPSTMLRFTVTVADEPELWPILRTILA